MYLFVIEEHTVYPKAEVLLIHPFNKIWARDKSKKKVVALAEMSFIEFMSSSKSSNPFKGYGEEVRAIKIKERILFPKKWKADALVLEGMSSLVLFQTEASVSYSYHQAAKLAAEQMKEFFTNLNIRECNLKTGNPLFKPKDITSALMDTGKVLANLKELEIKVETETFEVEKIKSGKDISPFATQESFKG